MPPKPKQSQSKNKYPVEQCKTFMKEVSQAGFGSVEEVHNALIKERFIAPPIGTAHFSQVD